MKVSIPGIAFVLLAVVLLPWPGSGQDFSYKARLYGGVGTGGFYDDEGSLGNGQIYHAGVE